MLVVSAQPYAEVLDSASSDLELIWISKPSTVPSLKWKPLQKSAIAMEISYV